jgi:hypothetical protein
MIDGDECGSISGINEMNECRRNPSTIKNTCPRAALSATDSTPLDTGSNPVRSGLN